MKTRRLMSSAFWIEEVQWSKHADALRAVRCAVFVEEQGIPETLEWDGRDGGCIHVLARAANGLPVGTARMPEDGHIGRMAVLKAWRGCGGGRALLAHLVAIAAAQGLTEVWLSAQTSAAPFYYKNGFRADGEVYVEAGILHQRMRRMLVPVRDPHP